MIVVLMLSIKNVNIEVSCEKECRRRVLNSRSLFQSVIQSSPKEVGADGSQYSRSECWQSASPASASLVLCVFQKHASTLDIAVVTKGGRGGGGGTMCRLLVGIGLLRKFPGNSLVLKVVLFFFSGKERNDILHLEIGRDLTSSERLVEKNSKLPG